MSEGVRGERGRGRGRGSYGQHEVEDVIQEGPVPRLLARLDVWLAQLDLGAPVLSHLPRIRVIPSINQRNKITKEQKNKRTKEQKNKIIK